jgi:hypothetical protein
MPFYNEACLIIMNQDKFDAMPEAMQNALLEACQTVFEDFTATDCFSLAADYDVHSRFLSGMEEVIFMSEAEIDKMEAACSYIVENYAASLDKQGLDGSGALELLRELADKYNALYPGEVTVALYDVLSGGKVVTGS